MGSDRVQPAHACSSIASAALIVAAAVSLFSAAAVSLFSAALLSPAPQITLLSPSPQIVDSSIRDGAWDGRARDEYPGRARLGSNPGTFEQVRDRLSGAAEELVGPTFVYGTCRCSSGRESRETRSRVGVI